MPDVLDDARAAMTRRDVRGVLAAAWVAGQIGIGLAVGIASIV